jgi:S-adenosylmethionine synthetase
VTNTPVAPYRFTSESVSEGHPDKVADRISDAILDACLAQNPRARVAAETLVTTGRCVLAGEVGGVSGIDFEAIARDAIRALGYEGGEFGWDTARVDLLIHEQAGEIRDAVAEGGAGDQGIMFGYACDETTELMPAAIHYAHRIVERLAAIRRGGETRLRPDAKSQLTLDYENGRPVRAAAVVVSQQHAPGFEKDVPDLVRAVVKDVLPDGWLHEMTVWHVNPSGSFLVGGPAADTGLTGRKIVVDTYGGAAPHGGGAFSGKDPSKVDRSAAYAARWLAKNVVASRIADRCLVQLAYAIGVAEPVAIRIDTMGTSLEDEWTIARAVRRSASLTPNAIRERLGLDRPIYARTSAYGHFGRTPDPDGGFSWERTDLARALVENLS